MARPESPLSSEDLTLAKDWTVLLETILPRPCWDRPLVCDGFPDSAQVIVIGENPATEMDTDWWTYWDPETGFDYIRFIANYQRQRENRGEQGTSNTRLRLNRIRQNGIRAVESNCYQNQQLGGAGGGVSNYRLLHLLIENMSDLKAVIAHGEHAKRFMKKANLPDNLAVFPTKHFRFVSYREVDEICQQIVLLPRHQKST